MPTLAPAPLAGFPSRRNLSRDATGNAAALTMNYSRHGTAKRCKVFGIKLRKFFFTDVLNVFLHVFGVRWPSGMARVDSKKAAGESCGQSISMLKALAAVATRRMYA
jgi:hypothetical protein